MLNAIDPKTLWEDLEKFHKEESQALRAQLRRQLQKMKMSKGEAVAEFIKRVKNVSSNLKAAGHLPEEDEIVCVILSGLSDEYEAIVTILENASEELTVTTITPKLLRHEAKLKEGGNGSGNGVRDEKAFSTRENRRCYVRKKKGHIARNCRCNRNRGGHRPNYGGNNNGNRRSQDKNAQVAVYFLTMQEKKKECDIGEKWIMGSGAFSHMTCNKHWLKRLRKSSDYGYVRMGDGHKIQIRGIGEVSVEVVSHWRKSIITLRDALFAPDMSTNLISAPRATTNGMGVNFTGDRLYIKSKDGSTHARGFKDDNLCYLLGKTSIDEVSSNDQSALLAGEEGAKLWHYRLGRLNCADLKKLSDGMALGIKIKGNFANNEMREPCVKGKSHREPLPKARSENTKEVFELAHSDLCGSITPTTLGGASYMLTLTDDYSRRSWVRFLRRKSDAAQNVKGWIAYVENQYNKKIKMFRSDRGGEYLNNELEAYFKSKGIKQETTVAYAPSQSGVAERLNRTLIEKARSMLQQMPEESKKLWAEAVSVANYVRSRSPTKALKSSTPFEILNKRKPNLSHLRAFGSKAYVYAHKEQGRKKLDSKAKEGVFVGYSARSKGYRIYDDRTKEVTMHRDVTFDENAVLKCDDEGSRILEFTGDVEEKASGSGERDGPESTTRSYPQRERRQTRFYQPGDEKSETAAVAYTEPNSYKEALQSSDQEIWRDAIDDEYNSLIKSKTWTLCALPPGREAIKSKWVFKLKRNENGEVARHKARLVAKGYTQRPGIDYDEIFAPASRLNTLRVLLSIAAAEDLEIMQVDIKTAFLNGKLEEEVHMEQPEGYVENRSLVCRLWKTIYGLKQAPRAWHKCLKVYLEDLGFKQSNADPGLFVKHENSGRICILIYVDDLLVFGANMDAIEAILSSMEKKFDLRRLGAVNYFLGVRITRNRETRCIMLSQEQYALKLLKKLEMEHCHENRESMQVGHHLTQKMSPKTDDERREISKMPHQSLIGGLMCLSNCTRPDISHAVGALSRYMQDPGLSHWRAAKGVLRYLKGASKRALICLNNIDVMIYCDADYANDIDTRRSTTGYVINIGGGSVSWGSRLQQTVALSTTEAEYMAAAEVGKELLWLKKLFGDLGIHKDLKTLIINCDNQSCIKLVKNPGFYKRSKHIEIKHHFIRDLVEDGSLKLKYCNTKDMIADVLTKAAPSAKVEVRLKGMGIFD